MHVDESCSCSFESVASSEVARVIRQGSFPLIEIKSSTSRPGGVKFHIRPWKRSSRYTSISHVWSHGLGSQSSNSLPTCQLRKLLKAVKGIQDSQTESQLIWMDILFIPVSEEYAAEKKKSIDKMGLIYAVAEKTLVLDYELQKISIKNLHRTEILAYLLTCTWMERAWTFNEGSLSRSCWFQFADEAFEKSRVHEIWFQKPSTTLAGSLLHIVELELAKHCLSQFNSNSYELDKDGVMISTEQSLDYSINCWNVLVCRSTTKPEYLAVILANLGGINIWQILRFGPDESLAALISF